MSAFSLSGPVQRDGGDPVGGLDPEIPPLLRQRDRSANGLIGAPPGPRYLGPLTVVGKGILVLPAPTAGAERRGAAMELSPSAHVDTFCRDRPARRTVAGPALRPRRAELSRPAQLRRGAAGRHHRPVGPDRPCLRTPTETWTYGDLLRHANQAARVLVEDFGLVPGNRVLLRGPNNPWLIASWFAVIKAGGVAVTMALLRAGEIAALAASPSRAWPSATTVSPPNSTPRASASRRLRTAGIRATTWSAAARARTPVPRGGHRRRRRRPLAPTSGTTGKPKATMHFHRDVLAIQDTFGRHVLQASPDDLFLGTPPVGFTFGLGGLVVFPFSIGACTCCWSGPRASWRKWSPALA